MAYIQTRQPEVTGLSTLGEVIADAGANFAKRAYADKVHERTRAEQLADESSARKFQVDQQKAAQQWQTEQQGRAWTHEAETYNARKWDAIKAQLIKDGYLAPGDADNPDAMNAALKGHGLEYERSMHELSEYKAAAATLIAKSEGQVNVGNLMLLEPKDIKEARAIMKRANEQFGAYAMSQGLKRDRNATQGAALISAHLARLADLSDQQDQVQEHITRLTTGNLTSAEEAKIRTDAEATLAARGIKKPSKAELDGAIKEQAGLWQYGQLNALQNQAKLLNGQMAAVGRQYEGVKVAIGSGSAGYMDDAAIQQMMRNITPGDSKVGPANLQSPAPAAEAENDPLAAFVNGTSTTGDAAAAAPAGNRGATPPPAATPAAAPRSIGPEPSLANIQARAQSVYGDDAALGKIKDLAKLSGISDVFAGPATDYDVDPVKMQALISDYMAAGQSKQQAFDNAFKQLRFDSITERKKREREAASDRLNRSLGY